ERANAAKVAAETTEAEKAELEQKVNGSNEIPMYDFGTLSEIFVGLGLTLEPILGESDTMFGTKANSCEIAVDAENMIIFFRKPIRRATKYVRMVDDLNQRDIRVVYA